MQKWHVMSVFPASVGGSGILSLLLFRKTFFTWAHQDTVRAVAVGLAQAGAVDGYIWETLDRIEPELTRETRVVAKSDWYGFPPIVARRRSPRMISRQSGGSSYRWMTTTKDGGCWDA